MNYVLMPLDAHYDSGFGAVAESFREAATTLRKAVPDPAFFGHLPQSFLFRHSVELFLKSEIIILHRKLRLPYGTHPHDGPPWYRTAENGSRSIGFTVSAPYMSTGNP
jgi:hypothetical protein